MNNNLTSQKLTFQELINKRKIEIPIIQRDYAQGREGKDELRKNFLDALYCAVTDGNPLELDFVYGDIKQNTLKPLDGQQRLTTLFLLHWYIATNEEILDSNLKDILSKFTYETRTSSREFCKKLISEIILFNELLETDYHDKEKRNPKNNQLSKTIENSNWFFSSWKRDPTIKSMLTMLDAIHERFNSKSNMLWDKLENISFHFVELEGFGLSDDLYIKMNARGKALTEFENFKAKFEQYIQQKGWEKDLEPTETFAHKIDTVWADLFWKHKGDDFFIIDYEIINFIAGIAINNHGLKGNEKRVQELFNMPIKIRIEDIADKESFDMLTKTFDLYSDKLNNCDELEIDKVLLCNSFNSNSLFGEFIKDSNKGTGPYNGPTYAQRVFFFAQTQFLMEHSKSDDSFYNWIRFIRNIIENTTIDSDITFVRAIKAIRELSPFQDDILMHLKNGDCNDIPFFGTQISEEKIKAQLILNDKGIDWKTPIITIENHKMFKGNIGFLLNDNESSEFETFLKWSMKATDFFDDDGVASLYSNNSILIKALVSQFDKWELLKKLEYDSTKDNWAGILKSPILIPYVQKLLNTNSFEDLLEMQLSYSQLEDSIQRLVHEDLYKSELLNIVENGSYLRTEYNNYILYPYNARAEWKKYIIGSLRNEILANKIKEGTISLARQEQQLKVNGRPIPYFWGWDIGFHYQEVEYIWDYNNKILNVETGIESDDPALLNWLS